MSEKGDLVTLSSNHFFCFEPWEHLEVAARGDVYVCCSGWVPRVVGNIFDEDLRVIWEGHGVSSVRDAVLEGTFSECRNCPFLPRPFGPVTRSIFSSDIIAGSARIASGRIPLLTLSYDRTCNLTCPSCRKGIEADGGLAEDVTRKLIESGALKVVDRVVVAGGGEPFASPAYQDFFRNVLWNSFPNLRVRLFTNGQLADWEHWISLGETVIERVDQVTVSFDAATEKTYALNRGENFWTLLGNMDKFSTMRRDGILNRFELTFVVQANNFREMPAFADLAASLGADVAYFGKLRNWGAYTPWDYACRAVHDPLHPEHAELLRVLENEKLKRPGVVLANFRVADLRVADPERELK